MRTIIESVLSFGGGTLLTGVGVVLWFLGRKLSKKEHPTPKAKPPVLPLVLFMTAMVIGGLGLLILSAIFLTDLGNIVIAIYSAL